MNVNRELSLGLSSPLVFDTLDWKVMYSEQDDEVFIIMGNIMGYGADDVTITSDQSGWQYIGEYR